MSLSTITNGESGSSVRTKLNSLKDLYNSLETYNVKLYGLVGDGVTDDRAALNTLLNTTAATGSTIFFPPGTYLIGSNIAVSDKRFSLIGSQATIKTTADVSILTISSTVADATRWRVQGLIFQGNDTGTSQIGLNFSDNSGSFQIVNCSFTDFGGSGIAVANTETSGVLGGVISSCLFHSNNIGINLLSRGEYVNIIGCEILLNTTGIKSIAGNTSVVGCNIDFNTTGIQIASGTNNGHGIISSCELNHNSGNPLDIQDTSLYMTISNCHIYEGEIKIVNCTGVEFNGGIIDVATLTITTTTGTKFNHVNFDNAYSNTVTVTGNAPEFFRCSGDVPTAIVNNCGAWVDYSGTSTVTGWSSTTTKVIKYTVIGKVAIIEFAIQGTSNTTTVTFTTPFTNLSSSKARGCYGADNGVAIAAGAVAWANSNSGTVTVYTNWALASTWTASGNKHVVGSIELEIA